MRTIKGSFYFLVLLNLLFALRVGAAEFTILDVRTPAEYSTGHIQGAINMDFLDSSFEGKVVTLDKDIEYKVYCRSGNRSAKAVALMQKLGFGKLENLGSLAEAADKLKLPIEAK